MTPEEQEVLDVLQDKIYVLISYKIDPHHKSIAGDLLVVDKVSKRMTKEEIMELQDSSDRILDVMEWKDVPLIWKTKYENVQKL